MPVLVECISVIVRISAIKRSYPGCWEAFFENCPNQTLCYDSELARVGFMTPDHTKHFTEHLEAAGLVFLADGWAVDFVVADQQKGFTTPCAWAEIGHMYLGENETMRVAACRSVGSSEEVVCAPDDWRFEDSVSNNFTFIPNGMLPEFMDFLRHEGKFDVYRDLQTGEERYMCRTDL